MSRHIQHSFLPWSEKTQFNRDQCIFGRSSVSIYVQHNQKLRLKDTKLLKHGWNYSLESGQNSVLFYRLVAMQIFQAASQKSL